MSGGGGRVGVSRDGGKVSEMIEHNATLLLLSQRQTGRKEHRRRHGK